jgi:hypothetical protein
MSSPSRGHLPFQEYRPRHNSIVSQHWHGLRSKQSSSRAHFLMVEIAAHTLSITDEGPLQHVPSAAAVLLGSGSRSRSTRRPATQARSQGLWSREIHSVDSGACGCPCPIQRKVQCRLLSAPLNVDLLSNVRDSVVSPDFAFFSSQGSRRLKGVRMGLRSPISMQELKFNTPGLLRTAIDNQTPFISHAQCTW